MLSIGQQCLEKRFHGDISRWMIYQERKIGDDDDDDDN
jgi:hypothetical protein